MPRKGKVRHPDVPQKKYAITFCPRNTRFCSNITCGHTVRYPYSDCPKCEAIMVWLHTWRGKSGLIPPKGSNRWNLFYKQMILPAYEREKENIRKKTVDYKPSHEGETVR